MTNQKTLMLIKPNAVAKKVAGRIISVIEDANFEIEKIKIFVMSDELASEFYHVHKKKPFYDKLINFMTSGKTIALVLKKENAVESLRKVVGDTNPDKAKENTIRYSYGDDLTKNAVHASDSNEHALTEISIIFK